MQKSVASVSRSNSTISQLYLKYYIDKEMLVATLGIFSFPRLWNQSTGNACASELALPTASAVHTGSHKWLSRVTEICCGITKTILYLARSLLFYYTKLPLVQPQPTGLSWAAQRRRLHVHSPSRSSVVETPRTWTTVDVRLSTWRHVPSHASARAIPRLARVLPDTFRSYVI